MKRVGITLIRIYQILLSPFFPPACRFYPSCSEYARQAIEEFGFFRGSAKGILRLLKCHPFHPGGYDPVK